MMRISETFDGIQGEGVYAGVPMSFIRLAGCNLRCAWCDTRYAYEDGQDITVADINPQRRWVCITGGEPLLQQDELAGLILKLKHRGKLIEIETNGSIPPPSWAFTDLFLGEPVPMIDSWVIDVKLPSTGNPSSPKVIREWTEGIRPSDQIKLVVADRDDLDEANYWMQSMPRGINMIISPVIPCEQSWLQEVAEFCMRHDVRFSLQIHKVIWDNKRGV
jgi:7-carboxy-7-deazaguanine synthase